MFEPSSFDGEAYNPVPDSENRIHSDEIARALGFEGALVPGVTVSAYVVEPAVVAWGLDWLARGRSHVTVKKPVYDGRPFRVEVRPSGDHAYDAELLDSAGDLRAVGRVELPDEVEPAPGRRGDAPVQGERSPPTREGLERLRERGMGSIRVTWDTATPMARYLRDPSRAPALLRPDEGGYANTSFTLGLTNWVFAANVAVDPWVHLETTAQHHAPIALGSELVVEARVADLFERKGHEFVDVDVAAFLPNDVPVLSARLRAIYRLRSTDRV